MLDTSVHNSHVGLSGDLNAPNIDWSIPLETPGSLTVVPSSYQLACMM